MSGATRRSVLAAVGGVAALAGCMGGDDGNGESGESEPTDGTRLSGLRVANNDDTDHRVALQIERDDEVVHWADYTLSERAAGEESVASVAADWPAEPAAFTIEVQIDGDSHRQFAVEDGCRNVFIEIDSEGRLEKYTNDGSCGSEGNESASA